METERLYIRRFNIDDWNDLYEYLSGYALESAKYMINTLFKDFNAHRIYAECNPENIPSWKLLERLGFQREGHLRKNVYFNYDNNGLPIWQDTYIYGLLKGK